MYPKSITSLVSKAGTIVSGILLASQLLSAQTVPSYISTTGLQAWYPFNGNANNEYGTGKNGVVLGPFSTTDRFGTNGSAYYFNGNGDHINIDTAFFNIGWSGYSISCWLNSDTLVNIHAVSNNQAIINTYPHYGMELAFNYFSNNKYNLLANANPLAHSWTIMNLDTSHAPVTVHAWNHIVLTKSQDTVYRFYVNGVLDRTLIKHVSATNAFCKLILGRIDTTYANEGFLGKLDDYGIWNREIHACEVKRLYLSAPYTYVTVQPADITTAPTTTVHFAVTDTGSGNTYQWQMDAGTGFGNMSNTGPYSGVTTATVTITGVTVPMNNNKFRCVVAGAQPCVDTSAFGRLTIATTAISQLNQVHNIALAPNPTTGIVSISGANGATVKVYNSIGQLVRESVNTDRVSISDQPSGIYLFKLYSTEGNLIFQDKVLKQ